MAKKTEMTDLRRLEQENALLKQRIADQEALRESMMKVVPPDLSSEMRKIIQKGKAGGDVITVTERNDHRNIRLWTRDGLPIGPLHPSNAMQTLNTFAANGIFLTVDRPTQAQVEAYCATPEYKEIQRKEAERRERKLASRRKGTMEKLTAEIAKQTGVIGNYILKQGEVKQH